MPSEVAQETIGAAGLNNASAVNTPPSKGKAALTFLVAPLSGIIEVTTGHPLDTLKTKIQELSLKEKPSSIRHAVGDIYNAKGFLGFYGGYTPRVIGIMPMRLVYWGTMRTMNEYVASPACAALPSPVKMLLPGVVTGSVQTLVDNPIEVLKIRMMTGASGTAINTLSKGFAPTTIRNIVFAVPVALTVTNFGKDNAFLAGATGGLIGSVLSQPLDVIKTEMQRFQAGEGGVTKKSMVQVIREINAQPGGTARSFMAGVSMRGALSVVNMGVGYLAYDHIYSFVSKFLELN
jgi:hypothetical protein